MVLVYVDYIFCIHKDTLVVNDAITIIYVIKQGSMGPLTHYLGESSRRCRRSMIMLCGRPHSGYHCKAAIANLEKTLSADGKSLSQYGNGRRPYPSSFHTNIDTSAELDENCVHEYLQHICVLHWVIELGIMGIMTEVNTLSHHLCDPLVNYL